MSLLLVNPLNGQVKVLRAPLTEEQIVMLAFKAMKVFNHQAVNESLERLGGFLNLEFIRRYRGLFELQLLSPSDSQMDAFDVRVFILEAIREETISLVPNLHSSRRYTRILQGEMNIPSIMNFVEVSQGDGSSMFGAVGCGMGLVVVAAAFSQKFQFCFGIDSEVGLFEAHESIIAMAREWADFYGLELAPFRLITGDVMAYEYKNMLLHCNSILVDNYNFLVQTNQRLEEVFFDLEAGTQLVSTKSFMDRRNRRNSRSIGNLSYILDYVGDLDVVSAWSALPFKLCLQNINGNLKQERLQILATQN